VQHHVNIFLDPETGHQALATLFLFLLGLLLSEFRSPKALSFLGRSSWNFHTY